MVAVDFDPFSAILNLAFCLSLHVPVTLQSGYFRMASCVPSLCTCVDFSSKDLTLSAIKHHGRYAVWKILRTPQPQSSSSWWTHYTGNSSRTSSRKRGAAAAARIMQRISFRRYSRSPWKRPRNCMFPKTASAGWSKRCVTE